MLGRVTTGDVRSAAHRRVLRRRRQVLVGAVLLLLTLVAATVLTVVRSSGGATADDAAAASQQAADPADAGGTDAEGTDAEGTDAGRAQAARPADDPGDPAAAQGGVGDGAAPLSPTVDAEAEGPAAAPEDAAPAAPEAAPAPPGDDPVAALAGITGPGVPDVGTGSVDVVPGAAEAPDPAADVVRVRVAVEGGLPVDGAAFAALVMATLNDGRSWVREGYSFARTDGEADVEVVLASPQTSAALCRPLRTGGTLSCHNDGRAIITHYRWANGSQDYAADLTGYRQYVVNHEVGHYLGHGHVGCPGAGSLAPVMMQQTKGIGACAPNPWPFP